jgi:hypothetical protein
MTPKRIVVTGFAGDLLVDRPEEVPEKVWQWLSSQPFNALTAYLEGATWEWRPESSEFCEEYLYFCSDCNGWHRAWAGHGVLVENNKVFVTLHTVDRDGDWEQHDAMNVEEPEFDAWFDREFGAGFERERRQALLDYLEWVVDHGQDPLDQLTVRSNTREVICWLWLRWTPEEGLTCSEVEAIGVTPGKVAWDRAPEEVKAFVEVSKQDFPTYGSFYNDLMHMKINAEVNGCPVVLRRAEIRIAVESPEAFEQRLRQAAQNLIAVMQDES